MTMLVLNNRAQVDIEFCIVGIKISLSVCHHFPSSHFEYWKILFQISKVQCSCLINKLTVNVVLFLHIFSSAVFEENVKVLS